MKNVQYLARGKIFVSYDKIHIKAKNGEKREREYISRANVREKLNNKRYIKSVY